MRGDPRHHLFGFTLVEVLVAMLILGIVATGLLSLTSSSLRFTGLSTAVSVTTQDLADAEGYLADTFRNAKAVFASMQLVDGTGAVVVDCDLVASADCVAVLTPVQDTSAGSPHQPIINYDLSVFSIEPIGTRFLSVGVPRGWNDNETLALLEYRVPNICATECSTVPGTLTTSQRTWSGSLGYLLGGLTRVDDSGNSVDFFAQPNSASLLINMVVRADAAAGQPYVVRRSPVALQVTVRE